MSDASGSTGAQGAAGTTTGTGAQGATGDQPQGGDAGQGQGSAGTGTTSTTDDGLTPEQLRARVAEREAENARYRERIRAFEAAEEERRRQGMTELEQRDARIRELEEENRSHAWNLARLDLRETAGAVASELGFRNPALAHRLVDDAAINDDGTIDKDRVAKDLRDALKSDPYLGTGGGAEGGAGRDGGGGAGGGGDTFNDQLRSQLRNKRGG